MNNKYDEEERPKVTYDADNLSADFDENAPLESWRYDKSLTYTGIVYKINRFNETI